MAPSRSSPEAAPVLLLVPRPTPGDPAHEALEQALEEAGLSPVLTHTGGDLLAALERDPGWRLVLLSCRSLEVTRVLVGRVVERAPDGVRILVAAPELSMEAVLCARQGGGGPLLMEPLAPDALLRFAPRRDTPAEGLRIPEEDPGQRRQGGPRVVGASPALVSLLEVVGRVGPTSASVLLQGESGTGKELLARALHEASGVSGSFLTLNCAALPERLLEGELFGQERGAGFGDPGKKTGRLLRATGGTLFLAEVDRLPPALQARLADALDEGRVTPLGADTPRSFRVRVVAGSSRARDASGEVGGLAPRLAERIGEVRLHLPPLRERSEDLLPLTFHFLRLFAERYRRPLEGITEEAVRLLASHRWAGNVRELRNVVDRAVLRSRNGWVGTEDLGLEDGSPHLSASDGAETGYPPTRSLAEVERDHMAKVLRYTGGTMTEAARILGIHRNTLTRRVDQHGLREVLAGEGVVVGGQGGPDESAGGVR